MVFLGLSATGELVNLLVKRAQLSFLPRLSLEHGGRTRAGRRKTARPLDPKRPVHLVLRSLRARGEWSLLRPANQVAVEAALERAKRASGVRVYRFVNVGNHLHLLVGFRTRRAFQRFLRSNELA